MLLPGHTNEVLFCLDFLFVSFTKQPAKLSRETRGGDKGV